MEAERSSRSSKSAGADPGGVYGVVCTRICSSGCEEIVYGYGLLVGSVERFLIETGRRVGPNRVNKSAATQGKKREGCGIARRRIFATAESKRG